MVDITYLCTYCRMKLRVRSRSFIPCNYFWVSVYFFLLHTPGCLSEYVNMSLELDRLGDHPSSHGEYGSTQPPTPALPPSDRGVTAWKFLVGSFLIEAVIWGELD